MRLVNLGWRGIDEVTIGALPFILNLLILDTYQFKLDTLNQLIQSLKYNPVDHFLRYHIPNYALLRLRYILQKQSNDLHILLKHPDIRVRLSAIEIWSQKNEPQHFQLLLSLLTEEKNHRLRVYLLKYADRGYITDAYRKLLQDFIALLF